MKRLSIAGLIALILSMSLFGIALAHADLESSNPEDGATLTAIPETITLVFSEELNEQSGFTVVDTSGATVGEGKLDLNDLNRKTVSGAMATDAPSGTYTVNWVAVSAADDNREEGNISFTIDIQAPTAAPTLEPTAALTEAPTLAATEPAGTVVPTESPRPTLFAINSPTSPDGPALMENDDGSTAGRMIALGVGLITILGITAAVVLTRRRGGGA